MNTEICVIFFCCLFWFVCFFFIFSFYNNINLYFVFFLAPSSVPDPHSNNLPCLMHNFFCVEINEKYKRCAYPFWISFFFYSTINKGMKITHGDATPGSKMKTKTYLYIFVRSFIRILSDTCFMFYVLFIYHCVYTYTFYYMKHYVETSYCFIASIVCIWYR